MIVNTVAASNHCLLITGNVPRKANARRPVVTIETVFQRTIGYAWSASEARQINLFRNQERIETLRGKLRIEDTRTIQLVATEAHAFPAKTDVERQSW